MQNPAQQDLTKKKFLSTERPWSSTFVEDLSVHGRASQQYSYSRSGRTATLSAKSMSRRLRSLRADERRATLVHQIKLMSPQNRMNPKDLHRQAVKDAAALSREGRQSLEGSQRSVIYDENGVYLVRGPEPDLDASVSKYLYASASQPPRLGRYSAKQGGLLSEVLAPTGSARGCTKLDLIMKNGRKQEDERDDELSRSIRATRYQQLVVQEGNRQTKKSARR